MSDPVKGMADLREVTPPVALAARVMQKVAAGPPPGLWAWMRRPRRIAVSVSPLEAAGFALGAAVVLLALGALNIRDQQPLGAGTIVIQAPSHTPAETVLVRFVLATDGARRVTLAGDFNGWSPDHTVLQDGNADGTFAATLALPPGTYQYMFVVDGRWTRDPAADELRPDGFGRQNAVLRL